MMQIWLDIPVVYCTLCRRSAEFTNQFKNGFPSTLALSVVSELLMPGGWPAYRISGVTEEQARLEALNKGWLIVKALGRNCDACFFCPNCVALLKESLR